MRDPARPPIWPPSVIAQGGQGEKKSTVFERWVAIVAGLVTIPATLWAFLGPQARSPLTPDLERDLTRSLRPIAASTSPASAEREGTVQVALEAFIKHHHLQEQATRNAANRALDTLDQAAESLERGAGAFERRDFAGALNEFGSAARVDPDNPSAWSSLGATYMLLGRREEARGAYDRSLTIDPSDWRTRYNFGLFFARCGDSAEALHHLTLAIQEMARKNAPAELRAQVLHELATDPDLANIRRQPGFVALLQTGGLQ